MRTTVLLLCTDEARLLEHSLPAAVAQAGAEVVVVDNASTDAPRELARAHGARYERLPERLSYAAAMNRALAATEGEAVLMLNPDCFLAEGFLSAATPRLAEEGVGSVAVRLLRTEGPGRESRLAEIDAAGMVLDRRRKNGLVGHGSSAAGYRRAGEAFGADGAAALYRRETLADCAVEGEVLDEDMERWTTDADLAWRARLRGWRCAYEPGALAWHVRTYSPTTRARVSERDRRDQFRNRLLMVAKNEGGPELRRDAGRIAAYEVLALGHVLLRERHLLGGYAEAARLLRRARRRRAVVQRRRAAASVPFGLQPPAATSSSVQVARAA